MNTYFPEVRSLNHPERLILMIYNDSNHFSFSLYDPEKRGFSFHKELIPENQSNGFSFFKEISLNNDFFTLPFRKIWIMNRTPVFTFIPNSIYDDSYKEDYMRFLFLNHRGVTLDHSVSSAGITILYQLANEVYDFLVRSFDNAAFIHYSAPVITYFLMKSKKEYNRQMIVNLQENGVDIFCFSNRSFLFGNWFSCKNLPEVIYYILFTWKQLQLDQLTDSLLVTGNVAYKEDLISKLAPYIQQVQRLIISPDIFLEGVEPDRIPIELAALSLCES